MVKEFLLKIFKLKERLEENLGSLRKIDFRLTTYVNPSKSKMVSVDRNIMIKQFERHRTYVHYAEIVKGNKVLARSFNRVKACPEAHSLHAERSVVKALGDVNRLKGTTLVVIRIGKNSEEFKNSKPCLNCEGFLKACMKKYGLKRVIYS